MKTIILTLLIGMFFSSCATINRHRLTAGAFRGENVIFAGFPDGCSGEVTLSLNKDKTFHLNRLGIDYSGRWEFISNRHVLLIFNALENGYLVSCVFSAGEDIVEIINENEIRLLAIPSFLSRESSTSHQNIKIKKLKNINVKAIIGVFRGKFSPYNDDETILSLNADKTFYINWNNTDYVGKWEFADNIITLIFDDYIGHFLYRYNRETTINITDKNILLLDNYVLTRAQ